MIVPAHSPASPAWRPYPETDGAWLPCQRPGACGSGPLLVMGSLREQDALAQEVGVRPSVHLSFDHFDAVDVAFDGAGAVGEGEPGGYGGPVFAESGGEGP